MKALVTVIGFWLVFLLPNAYGQQYLEGVEYVEIAAPQPTSAGDKVEVREAFLYVCPHCYRLEPLLDKWLQTKPANVAFVRMPVIFRPDHEAHARAYYAFESMGVLPKVHKPFFRAIHEPKPVKPPAQSPQLNDEAGIARFVAGLGVDERRFRQAYRSFSVDALVRQTKTLGPALGIDSVPTMIVDGKYRTNATMAGSHESMLRVVNHLIKKAADERKERGDKMAPAR